MRIERYYSSIKEDVATLTDDAQELLTRQDYVGFFRACGPNFVRGIRRAQEVTATFSFKSSNTEATKEFSKTVTTGTKKKGDNRDYRGRLARTKSGYKCKKWTDNSWYNPTYYPNTGLGNHNYCRNPDLDSDAWCVIQGPAPRWWEFCDIPTNVRTSGTTTKESTKKITSSLEISIVAFGIGFSDMPSANRPRVVADGGDDTASGPPGKPGGTPNALAVDTFVATSLEEYQEVMKFAFRTMTSAESFQVGMVYGIEVAPWVETTQYQLAANLDDQINIEIPIPRSLIHKAFQIADRGNTTGFDNASNRDDYVCKNPLFSIDRYGYCCEANGLFDVNTNSYDSENPEAKICRPMRTLDKNNVKANLATNAEFVARLESSVRFKLNQMSTLERCIGAARAFPARFDGYSLKAVDTVKFDAKYDPQFTIKELKLALDPFGDFALVTHLAKELDEFVEMFYAPCMAALFGNNVATTPGTDTSYFFAYPWYSHEECMHLSCFGNGMRWNRKDGGCLPGLVTGSNAAAYDSAADESSCKSDPDKGGDAEECKHTTADLSATYTKMTECWAEGVPAGSIDYFMQNYCMPELTGKKGPNIDLVLAGSSSNKCEDRDDTDTETRLFNLVHKDTGYYIENHFGTCDVDNDIIIYHDHGGKLANQQYKYEYDTKNLIHHHCSGKVPAVESADCDSENDLKLVLKTKDTNDNKQKFLFYKDGTIRSVACPTRALKARSYSSAKIVLAYADPDDPLFQFRAEYIDY